MDREIGCLSGRILEHLSRDEFLAVWKGLQERMNDISQELDKEKRDRIKEREQIERDRREEQGKWAARERLLLSQIDRMSEDMTVRNYGSKLAVKALEMRKAERKRQEQQRREQQRIMLKRDERSWFQMLMSEIFGSEQKSDEGDIDYMEARELKRTTIELRKKLATREEVIKKLLKQLEASKYKREQVKSMADIAIAKNLAVFTLQKDLLKQRIEKLEQEIQMLRSK